MTGKFTQVKLLGILLFVIMILLLIFLPYIGVFLDSTIVSYIILGALMLIILGVVGEKATGG